METINYDECPEGAESMLSKYRIARHDVTEDRRAELVVYFETMLTHCRSDAPGRFTVNGVTVTFTGHDAAANFLRCFR